MLKSISIFNADQLFDAAITVAEQKHEKQIIINEIKTRPEEAFDIIMDLMKLNKTLANQIKKLSEGLVDS